MSDKICPRCKLDMNVNSALNALSHDGKTEICTMCGQIESLEKLGAYANVEGLRIQQRRLQGVKYGVDKNGDPKLPKEE